MRLQKKAPPVGWPMRLRETKGAYKERAKTSGEEGEGKRVVFCKRISFPKRRREKRSAYKRQLYEKAARVVPCMRLRDTCLS